MAPNPKADDLTADFNEISCTQCYFHALCCQKVDNYDQDKLMDELNHTYGYCSDEPEHNYKLKK